ncbi:MAG: Asp-tRNA(Asn)/Glu-tRNA(Gln) amidotransferase subunit GatC [Bryobacterales bacterium]|nr:Asp-tRNA(Asn)/Glu-tRNA(Gln) amidotransferase subunit GatC [Bryobacterales bacterium]
MKLTEKDVRYVADLANLTLQPQEVTRMVTELGGILDYVEKLNELDTSDVPPMAQVLYPDDETATLRPDRQHTGLGSEVALANAPLSGAGHFKVPKVIER